MQTVERTDINYLRPTQIQEMRQEESILGRKLESKHIEDKAAVARQLSALQRSLRDQAPRAPETSDEEGRLVKRERELLEAIVPMMCSQEEMRTNPPGAVGKFNTGENSPVGKKLITEWKNIRLRLNPGSSDPDVANLERFRPTKSTLLMDNAQISRKQYFMPPVDAGLPVAFDAEQLALLERINPGIREQLATLSNIQRAQVKEIIAGGIGLVGPTDEQRTKMSAAGRVGAEKKKRVMSQQQKDALAAGRAAAALKRAEGKPNSD